MDNKILIAYAQLNFVEFVSLSETAAFVENSFVFFRHSWRGSPEIAGPLMHTRQKYILVPVWLIGFSFFALYHVTNVFSTVSINSCKPFLYSANWLWSINKMCTQNGYSLIKIVTRKVVLGLIDTRKPIHVHTLRILISVKLSSAS